MISTIEIPAGLKVSAQTFINPTTNSVNEKPVALHGELSSWQLKHEETVVSLAQLLTQSRVVSNLNYKLEAPRAFGEKKYQVILNFSLAEKYAGHFILLKGLFEFHNSKAVNVTADKAARTFSVDVVENTAADVVSHVETILNLLIKEINFKTILRGIIRLEERIKREQALAYETLRASV
jgi:hypothetical protein